MALNLVTDVVDMVLEGRVLSGLQVESPLEGPPSVPNSMTTTTTSTTLACFPFDSAALCPPEKDVVWADNFVTSKDYDVSFAIQVHELCSSEWCSSL